MRGDAALAMAWAIGDRTGDARGDGRVMASGVELLDERLVMIVLDESESSKSNTVIEGWPPDASLLAVEDKHTGLSWICTKSACGLVWGGVSTSITAGIRSSDTDPVF